MNRSRTAFPIVVSALVLAGAGLFGGGFASPGGRPLNASLAASNEVGQPGDVSPSGVGATGSTALTLNQGQGEICFDIELVGLTEPASRAHIHHGAVGTNGPIVVHFYEGVDNALDEGCVPRPVFSLALHALEDRGLAEEAFQDTFVKAWKAAGRYDPERPFGPWIYSIARRVAVDARATVPTRGRRWFVPAYAAAAVVLFAAAATTIALLRPPR